MSKKSAYEKETWTFDTEKIVVSGNAYYHDTLLNLVFFQREYGGGVLDLTFDEKDGITSNHLINVKNKETASAIALVEMYQTRTGKPAFNKPVDELSAESQNTSKEKG